MKVQVTKVKLAVNKSEWLAEKHGFDKSAHWLIDVKSENKMADKLNLKLNYKELILALTI